MRQAPRVLVLGASGLLGNHLVTRFARSFPTVAHASRQGRLGSAEGVTWLPAQLDADDPASIRRIIDLATPDVIVNAVGTSAREDADVMDVINGRFPHELAAAASVTGGRIVHISTDGVFSGTRGAYRETDPPDASDTYGRSKVAGELTAPHLTIRTSFFGRSPSGHGLLEWLVGQRGPIDGYVDYRFSGLAAWTLADLIAAAIAGRDLQGVVHVGGQPTTKFELLTALAETFQVPVTVRPSRRGPVDRTLDSTQFFERLDRIPPSLDEMLRDVPVCAGS